MKRIFFLMVMVFTGVALFAQSGDLSGWSDAFNRAQTVAEQLIFIRRIADGNYAESEAFYARALDRLLLQFPNITTRSEWDAADSTALILVSKLGEAQNAEAGLNLWRVVDNFTLPTVRAEALRALGKTGNTAFIPQIIQLLNDLNTRPQSDSEMAARFEIIASGAISALESYKQPEGFLPVYFASTGWYTDRIRSQASAALGNILTDPSDPMIQIIRDSGYTYAVKYLALQTSERSQASNEDKARVAVAALTEGWRHQVSDTSQRNQLYQMRLLALNMIQRYGTTDEAVYPPLDRSYRDGDMDEKLAAIQTLSALATVDSARLLSGYLNTIHIRRVTHILTANDEQLVRVIIPALGNVGSVGGEQSRPILTQVQQSSEWTNSVRNLAADALARIGN